MSTAILIAKLLEIERAVGKSDPIRIRAMLLEVQGCVLELEQQLIQTIQECQRLRERAEKCERPSVAGPSECTISKNDQVAMELSRPTGMKKKRGVRLFFSDASAESIN